MTNADFVPGELVIDGVIDAKDEDMFYEIMDKIASGETDYNMAADFNRDGVVNEKDAKVYEKVEEEKKAPAENFEAKGVYSKDLEKNAAVRTAGVSGQCVSAAL